MNKTKYQITLDNIHEYMDNCEFDSISVIDDQAGLDFKDDETKAALTRTCYYAANKSDARCVRLEISSFRGISWGAIHYYGKLIADGIDFQYIENPTTTTSNFGAKKINPFYQWRYEFRLRRPLTKEEIDADPDRWMYYEPESFTDCFETKEEIIALAKECFKLRFAGNWELWMEDNTVRKDGIYRIEL